MLIKMERLTHHTPLAGHCACSSISTLTCFLLSTAQKEAQITQICGAFNEIFEIPQSLHSIKSTLRHPDHSCNPSCYLLIYNPVALNKLHLQTNLILPTFLSL